MDVRPSRDRVCMDMADLFADRSTCSRNHVGAVVAQAGRILVTGYNGAPAGMDHCNHDCTCDLDYIEKFDVHSPSCPAELPCRVSVHAEANAIAYAARYGIILRGTTLYTTLSPCYGCAQLIINTGIKVVWYRETYRDTEGIELLKQAGLKLGTV